PSFRFLTGHPGWKAVHPTGAVWAFSRWPGPERPAVAVRRKAGWAFGPADRPIAPFRPLFWNAQCVLPSEPFAVSAEMRYFPKPSYAGIRHSSGTPSRYFDPLVPH